MGIDDKRKLIHRKVPNKFALVPFSGVFCLVLSFFISFYLFFFCIFCQFLSSKELIILYLEVS